MTIIIRIYSAAAFRFYSTGIIKIWSEPESNSTTWNSFSAVRGREDTFNLLLLRTWTWADLKKWPVPVGAVRQWSSWIRHGSSNVQCSVIPETLHLRGVFQRLKVESLEERNPLKHKHSLWFPLLCVHCGAVDLHLQCSWEGRVVGSVPSISHVTASHLILFILILSNGHWGFLSRLLWML